MTAVNRGESVLVVIAQCFHAEQISRMIHFDMKAYRATTHIAIFDGFLISS
jgi:hypothetical protein